ncbi:MAG TPA: type II toxin-antitoxin system RelE/ParE family toxin [Clostridia bacterium]|nr:type II toxin-antitoxin system RelE/ParE family toxin [Clostridia bacterium]
MTQIFYYTTPSGQNPIDKFLNSLSGKQQAKILRIFETIKESGLQSILPHVRKLTGTPLWEIRILGKDNLRIIYVVPYLDTVLLLHGFIKKTRKTPKKEIETALGRYYQTLDK